MIRTLYLLYILLGCILSLTRAHPDCCKTIWRHYDLDYIATEMDKKTKRNWLARNPVTIARHINFIFRKLWGNVILSGLHPVRQILNYDIRKEMQSRATAHFHSAVHVKEAPIIDKNSDEEVISFVDKYVRCSRAKS